MAQFSLGAAGSSTNENHQLSLKTIKTIGFRNLASKPGSTLAPKHPKALSAVSNGMEGELYFLLSSLLFPSSLLSSLLSLPLLSRSCITDPKASEADT